MVEPADDPASNNRSDDLSGRAGRRPGGRCGQACRAAPTATGGRPPTGANPLDVLEAQAATRVKELGPIRYERMAESAFAFFRGAAAVMSMDLASNPSTGIRVQACGDAHVNNFGFFASPERNLVFDINDFDETVPGPWEWDVKRLCTSLHVIARQRGWSADECDQIVVAAARTYREHVADYATWTTLDLWYERDRDQGGHRTVPHQVPRDDGTRHAQGAAQGPPPRGQQAHPRRRRPAPLHRQPAVGRAPRARPRTTWPRSTA